MPSLVIRRFKQIDCQIAETHIEELQWVVHGLDEVGGETVWSLRRWQCPQRDDLSFLDVLDVRKRPRPRCGPCAQNQASAFEPSLATATVRHHKPNEMTLKLSLSRAEKCLLLPEIFHPKSLLPTIATSPCCTMCLSSQPRQVFPYLHPQISITRFGACALSKRTAT